MARKIALPAVRFGNAAQDRWAAQVANALHTAAVRNEAIGKSVTLFSQGNSGAVVGDAQTPTLPTGFTAEGAYSTILLRWDMPDYTGHVATEVWRSVEDSFGTAVLIAESSVAVWSDAVGPAQGFYYWIRHRNSVDEENPQEGVERLGPLNATDGTFAETAQDIDALLALLNGEISEAYFSESLLEKLDLIGSIEFINASEAINNILLDIEALNLESIAALAKDGQADMKAARVEFVSDKGYALAQTTSFALADEVQARAGEVTRIEAKFDDSTSTITQLLTATSNSTNANASAITNLQATVGSVQANYASRVYVNSAVDAAEVSILQSALASFGSALAGYATEAYAISAANDAAAGTLTTIDARFNQSSGVYGLQIKAAVDAANAATQKSEALAAGIYDANGNLSQAFIDEVSLVAVEADGASIAGAIAAYTVNANGNVVGLQEVAEASIAADGQTFNSRWGVKTNVNGLVGGIGFLNDGSKTSLIVDSQLFSIIDASSGQVKSLFTAVSGDPDIPDGVYLDTAFIKAATIADLVAGDIAADTVNVGASIEAPYIYGGQIEGASVLVQAGAYQWVMEPQAESGFPLWYGKTSDAVNATNAVMAVDNAGKSYLKGLQIRNAANQIMMDIDGYNGAYIKDLSVDTLKIADNAVSVATAINTATIIVSDLPQDTPVSVLDETYNYDNASTVMYSFSLSVLRYYDSLDSDSVRIRVAIYQGTFLESEVFFFNLHSAGGYQTRFIFPLAGSVYLDHTVSTFRIVVEFENESFNTRSYSLNMDGFFTNAKK